AAGIWAPTSVWTYPMCTAVMIAIFHFLMVARRYPDRVRVFFDGKSLTDEARAMVERQVHQVGVSLKGVLAEARAEFPGHAELAQLSEGFMEPADVTVGWEDRPGFVGSPGAMSLADSLASRLRPRLRRE